jgi:hypothetical protein
VIGIALIACIVILIARYILREGYNDTTDSHKKYVDDRVKLYNPVAAALVSARTQGNLGSNTRPLFGTNVDVKSPDSDVIRQEISNPYPLNNETSFIYKTIKKCENVKTADCSAFNDSNFGSNCGICLDKGPNDTPSLDSHNKPSIGGRVLLPDDRKNAESIIPNFDISDPGNIGDSLPDYLPTFGTCTTPKNMVSNKAQCLRLTREAACQKNANYDQPGCAQCYDNGNYTIVDPSISPNLIKNKNILT